MQEAEEWEEVEMIVDSGASGTVIATTGASRTKVAIQMTTAVDFAATGEIRYNPGGTNVNLGNAALGAVAHAHAVSPAQAALRFVTQFGGARGHPLAVSPGTNVQYAREDLELGGFTLTGDEMAKLAAI